MAGNPIIQDILKRYTQVWALGHSMAVLGWDTETHMPEKGARPRGIASGQLAMMSQRATLELDGLVRKAEESRDLDDVEKGVVRVLRRSLDYYLKIPPELVDELQRVTREPTVGGRTPRRKRACRMF